MNAKRNGLERTAAILSETRPVRAYGVQRENVNEEA